MSALPCMRIPMLCYAPMPNHTALLYSNVFVCTSYLEKLFCFEIEASAELVFLQSDRQSKKEGVEEQQVLGTCGERGTQAGKIFVNTVC